MIYVAVVLALVLAGAVWTHHKTVESLVDLAHEERLRYEAEIRKLTAAVISRHGTDAQQVLKDRPARTKDAKAHEPPIMPEGL